MLYVSPLPRNVYLLGDGLLFHDIIARMLTSVTNLRVIKRVYDGESAFFADLDGCRPDVVLLTETDRYSCEQILALLSRTPLPVDLRIIVMSMRHKDIQIVDRPAGWNHEYTAPPPTLQEIDDWKELFDLVSGKPLRRTDD